MIIPAYNEAARIGDTLAQVTTYLRTYFPASEIIVVDDGSLDATAYMVENFRQAHRPPPTIRLLKNSRNLGKGASVRKGILAAVGQYVLFSDADLSTPIEELPRLLAKLEAGADLVIASRVLPGAVIEPKQHPVRETMGKMFNLLVQMLLFRGIRDTQCGFKLFRGEVAKELAESQKLAGFVFDVELLVLAKERRYQITQVPVHWRNCPCSRVRLIRDSIKMFFSILMLRWRR